VHNFGTCVWRTDAQWQLPGKKSVSTQEKSDFAIALRFSKCRRKEYWISPKTCSSGRLHNHHLQLTPISAPLRVHLNSAHPYLDEIFFPIKLKIIWPPVVTLLSDLYSHITLATTLIQSSSGCTGTEFVRIYRKRVFGVLMASNQPQSKRGRRLPTVFQWLWGGTGDSRDTSNLVANVSLGCFIL